ncbi:Protein FAR1-RELATED SEQUENCE [Abeliophyllum distichum]|uniref:Protein FAR1-RELATED SEQUENCE n=1 Tax=Abeliophyllum distichum TaxID=126358 RepID=A0ABD1V1F8_9LAMI
MAFSDPFPPKSNPLPTPLALNRCSSSTAVTISPPLPLSTSGSPLVNFLLLAEISQRFSDAAASSDTPFILTATTYSPSLVWSAGTRKETGNLWVVNKFVAEHNHALTTPSKVHLLRSHRNVSATKKALAHQFSEANIPTCQQLRIMEIDAGGPDSVGYVERDLRNHERNIQEELKGHDVETLIEYFSFEKEKSPNFYFDYDTDLDNKLVHYFWADSESCRSYAFFYDAAIFDTTYNTNKYSMIFAPFVGLNHHGQTVLFGCGLLSDESTESFVWLLSKFMNAMPGDAPQIIITDQDATIVKAISMVLPLTFHSCRTFEFEGYPCRHMISFFLKKKQVLLLPDKYILRRWTKNAKVVAVEYSSASISDGGSCSSSLFSRHGMLAHKSLLLVDDASLTDACASLLMEEYATLHLRIKAIDDGGNVGLSRSRNKNTEDRITIYDPSFVRAKGCRKRLKSSKDKSIAKNSRQCSAYGQNDHDKRTCPTLVGRSTMETYQHDMND